MSHSGNRAQGRDYVTLLLLLLLLISSPLTVAARVWSSDSKIFYIVSASLHVCLINIQIDEKKHGHH